MGKAGQLAVMAELALRGYNVAMPEIDIGDDIFSVNDENGNLLRVQVKTSAEKKQKKSKRYQFRIRHSAIQNVVYPDSIFIFVMRDDDRWRFLIVDRAVLKNYVDAGQLGKHSGQFQQVSMTLDASKKVRGSKSADFSHHLDDWSKWPAK
jgi:hypothetical protein